MVLLKNQTRWPLEKFNDFKVCVRYFLFSPKHLKNYEKWYSLHLKAYFDSKGIQIFVFPFSPLFYLSTIACEDDPR